MDSKEYILSINAQLKGNQVVISGLKSIEGATQEFSKTVQLAGTKTKDFGDMMADIGKRALLVAPVWMLLRSSMLMVIDTVKGAIQANLDLETSMSKIQGSLRGTTEQIQQQSQVIKELILSTSTNSGESIKQLSDAYMQLQKTLQNTGLAMQGFQATINLMSGTGLNATEAGNIMAKTYLEVGNSFNKALSPAEKFNKIADALVYTNKTTGTDINTLIQGYAKLAPALVGTSDSYFSIITLLGVLNNHFVEGGRAGTSFATVLANLSKNSKDLAGIFNIQLKAGEPINIINTFTQIQDKIRSTGKLSESQSGALSNLFGGAKTAGTAKELITNFDEVISKLKEAEIASIGFAKANEDLISNTTEHQMQRLSNNLSVLVNDFITGATKGEGLVATLKQLNEVMTMMRPATQSAGNAWGYFVEILQRVTPLGMIATKLGEMSVKGGFGAYEPPRSYNTFLADREKANNKAIADTKSLQAEEEKTAVTEQLKSNSAKEHAEYIKEMGSLLQALGADESQILEIKMQQLTLDHSMITDAQYLTEMEKMRMQQVVAITKEREKEALTMANLAFEYEKADEMERGRLRRMMELRNLAPEDLTKQFNTSGYDAKIIEQYRSNFSKEQQLAVAKELENKYKLPSATLGGMNKLPEDEMKELKSAMAGTAITFWDSWDDRKKKSLTDFDKEFRTIMNGGTGMGTLGIGLPGGESYLPKYTHAESLQGNSQLLIKEINVIMKDKNEAYRQAEISKRIRQLLENDAHLANLIGTEAKHTR